MGTDDSYRGQIPVTVQPERKRTADRACTYMTVHFRSVRTPHYEQRKLRSSGKHRMCGFANGRGLNCYKYLQQQKINY